MKSRNADLHLHEQLMLLALRDDKGTLESRATMYAYALGGAILSELSELTEQGRSYFDRAADARGLIGPPAVFAAIDERCHAVLDINHVTAGAAPERRVDLPVFNIFNSLWANC